MDFTNIVSSAADQDKGHEFPILDPVDGKPTGITMKIAGPDSQVQRRARLAMADELADLAAMDGRVRADDREKVHHDTLAACILDWTITEDGVPIPCTTKNILRVLKAGSWIAEQVDAYAADRSPYRVGGK